VDKNRKKNHLPGIFAVFFLFMRRTFRFSAVDLFVGLFAGSVYVSALAINDASGNTTFHLFSPKRLYFRHAQPLDLHKYWNSF
jgi:hypothetical protein